MEHNMVWRNYLLKLLKKYPHKVGAEVGVSKGITTQFLLQNLPDIATYYCVDPWIEYKEYTSQIGQESFNGCYQEAVERIKEFSDKVKIMKMKSVDAFKLVPKGSLDWVFIDANHAYDYVKTDILVWSDRVKQGGLIAGHDYADEPKVARYGVKLAVDEIFGDRVKLAGGTIWHLERY